MREKKVSIPLTGSSLGLDSLRMILKEEWKEVVGVLFIVILFCPSGQSRVTKIGTHGRQ